MRTRDREWLRTGTPPSFDTAASWTKEELLVANLLNKNGFSIQRVEPSKEFRERRCDCLLNGEKWEIKAPRGNGYLTIYNQFKKVVYGSSNVPNPQSDKLIISNVVSDMPMLKMAKGVQRTFEENAFLEISEVLLCDKGGELWRLKR